MRSGKINRTAISSAVSLFIFQLATATAMAQVAPATSEQAPQAEPEKIQSVVVTSQRQAQMLQDVPMSVTALTGSDLASRQINNALDLQFSVPNVSFTKAMFGATFTVRGVGDLCVGVSCDPATALHINDMPVLQPRIFETEFFDMQRIEVLRGPQGTLYGRNATAGVVNFITARPTFDRTQGNVQVEAGSYDSRKVSGMVNVPLNDVLAMRLAGTYVKRDGYTKNLFDNSRIDGRDLHALRATLRIRPSDSTTLDVIGSYFHENDNRSRFTKQLCARDETGVLGCRPDQLGSDVPNFHAGFSGVLSSQEFLGIASGGNPMFRNLGLSSLYGPDPVYGSAVNPTDLRQVNTDLAPTYVAKNSQLMFRLEQELGEKYALTVTGGMVRDRTEQRVDFNLAVADTLTSNQGLLNFAGLAAAPGAAFPGGANPFTQAAKVLFPGGLSQGVCTSEPNRQYTGIYGGYQSGCSPRGSEFENYRDKSRQKTIEAHLDSKLDGPFNFLVGGIYLDNTRENDYSVAGFAADYISAVLGGLTTLGQRAAGNTAYPNVFLAPPFYNSEIEKIKLTSYGVFGEGYYEVNDKVKLTAGLRYSSDKKEQRQRVLIESFPVPYGVQDAFQSPFAGAYDADSSQAGNQLFDDKRMKSSAVTGRFVANYQRTKDDLYYASYSRGYKSGGLNPGAPVEFAAASQFKKEQLDAVELGAKNTLYGGKFSLNSSAFVYKYKDLQISRLLARATLNDNADADIYGAELEAMLIPVRGLRLNLSASVLKTKLKELSIIDSRDPSGGRSDVVVIKDVTSGANCAVIPTVVGNSAGANGLVAAVNSQLGLRAPVALPGTNTTGAFSVCSALRGAAGNQFVVSNGVENSVEGNELPQSPRFKLSMGGEYSFALGNGLTLVPRVDAHYMGRYFSGVFNKPVDLIKGHAFVNVQVQLFGPKKEWFVRAFAQNLSNSDATTGRFVSDQSGALTTSVFQLEPRRFGLVAGKQF